ncbi:hypothetical protein [Bacillus sp. RS11]|uniref:hypothetical protein n=1 Tax=Lysinibacillus sp. RS11 TaxID=3242682 RepID=UPI0035C665D9
MKKFSFKVKKDIKGLEVNFSIGTNIINVFNETTEDNQIIKCNSLLFDRAEGKTSINIEFECTYKDDEFLRYSISKAYFFAERNLFETVLLATGKSFRRNVYNIDLHNETEVVSINKLSEISEPEYIKVQDIVKMNFMQGGLLIPEPITLAKSDIEEILSASLILSTKVNSEKKDLIQYALFYLNIMESQFHESGLNIFDYIQRFRLVWSAFNSIYQINNTGGGDKKDVEDYSQKPHVVNFFKNNFNQLLVDLEVLSEAQLKDKKNTDISELLKTAISDKNYEQVSLYTLLCIYVIRNTALHGKVEQNDELSLSRKAFSILTPIVTSSILEEIKTL